MITTFNVYNVYLVFRHVAHLSLHLAFVVSTEFQGWCDYKLCNQFEELYFYHSPH